MKSCKYIIGNTDVLRTAMEDIHQALKQFGTVNLEWKVKGKDRSLNQNALFHVWCGEIASQMYMRTSDESYTKPAVKLFLKKRFLGVEDIVVGKTVIKDQIRSSKKLDSGEMFFFMEQIEGFAFNHNISLSHPADNEYDKLRESQHET